MGSGGVEWKEKDLLEKAAEVRIKDYKDGHGRRILYEIELKKLKLEKVNALMRDEFMEYRDDELLEKVLSERHGSNSLQ